MFNQKNYFSYIKAREFGCFIKQVCLIRLLIIASFVLAQKVFISINIWLVVTPICVIGTIVLYYIVFIPDLIKIEEMKWKIDIYNNIKKESK